MDSLSERRQELGLGEVLEWDTEDEGEYTFPYGAQRILPKKGGGTDR